MFLLAIVKKYVSQSKQLAYVIVGLVALSGNAQEPRYLDVFLNDWNSGQSFMFFQYEQGFAIEGDSLISLLGQLPETIRRVDNAPHLVWLNGTEIFVADYNESTQQINLTVQPKLFRLTQKDSTRSIPKSRAQMLNSAWINTDTFIDWQTNQDELIGGAQVSLNARLSDLQFNSQHVAQRLQGESLSSVRLSSSVTWESYDQLTQLIVGDSISAGGNTSRSLRFGGVQYRKNYSLRPNLITFPTPAFGASSEVPSVVDLYINGLRSTTTDVGPGPFEFVNTPYVSGAGTATIVSRDIFGRQVVINQPFYVTPQLLRSGFSDYALSFGYGREDFGQSSFAYTNEAIFSGSYRHGVSSMLTLGGGLDWTSGYAGWRGEAQVRLGLLGALTSEVIFDSESHKKQWQVGYDYQGEWFRLNLSNTLADEGFNDLVGYYNQIDTPSRQTNASLSVNAAQLGSLSLAYIERNYAHSGRFRQDSQFVSASYSRSWGRGNVFANLTRDVTLDSWTASINFSYNFGESGIAVASHQVEKDQPSYRQYRYSFGNRGYQGYQVEALASQGREDDFAQLSSEWRLEQSISKLGVNNTGGDSRVFGSFQTAWVYSQNSFWNTRPIEQAFAIVKVGEYADVPVRFSHREIGKTDQNGLLLIPNVLSGLENHISFDPSGLPVNSGVEKTSLSKVPEGRGGVLYDFNVVSHTPVYLTVLNTSGEFLAPGTLLTSSSGRQYYVGWDGEAYVPYADLPMDLSSPECELSIPRAESRDDIVKLTVRCQQPDAEIVQ